MASYTLHIGLPVFNRRLGKYGLIIRCEPRVCNAIVKDCYDVRTVDGEICHWYVSDCKVIQ